MTQPPTDPWRSPGAEPPLFTREQAGRDEQLPAAQAPLDEHWWSPPPAAAAPRRRRGRTVALAMVAAGVVVAAAVLGALAAGHGPSTSADRGPGPHPTTAPRAMPPATVPMTGGPAVPKAGAPSPGASPSVEEDARTSAPSGGMDLVIGRDGVRYDDGVELAVSSAARWPLPPTATGAHPGYAGVVVVLEVHNRGTVPFDPARLAVSLRYGARRAPADAVRDVAARIGTGFPGAVRPGQTRRARYAWWVPPAGLTHLAVRVAPGNQYDPVTFTGAAR